MTDGALLRTTSDASKIGSSATDRPKEPRPVIQVLERTFAILGCFDETHPEWTTSGIARRLNLPVPTTHRILAALRRLEYVTQDAQSKRFRLGTAALALGTKARAVADLRTVALPFLRRLSRDLNETSLLTALSPDRKGSVCLERVESTQALRLSLEPGRQLPLHAGASQKALFAFLSEAEIDDALREPLEKLCRSTISDPVRLRDHLAQIRQQGFATSFEETNLGIWGISVPVLSDSDVACAVGVAAPSVRLTTELVRRSLRRTHATATEIAKALGLVVPQMRPTAASLNLRHTRRRS